MPNNISDITSDDMPKEYLTMGGGKRSLLAISGLVDPTDPPSASSSNFESADDSPAAKKLRTSMACLNCRKRHLKCPGGQPCPRCTRYAVPCEYVEPVKKIVVSVKYVADLQAQIAALKDQNKQLQLQQQNSSRSSASPNTLPALVKPPSAAASASCRDHIGSSFAQRSGMVVKPSMGGSLFLGSSSMTLFGLEIQSLISTYVTHKQFKPMPMNKRQNIPVKPSPLTRITNDSQHSVRSVTRTAELTFLVSFDGSPFQDSPPPQPFDVSLPSYPYACLLMDKFISYNDACFYFFNEGLMRHGMELVYNRARSVYPDDPTLELIWFCKLLLIFAIGEVYHRCGQETETEDTDNVLPGARWFLQASQIFNAAFSGENLHLLTREGGIEVLLLHAFYLQVADNTVLAYFYFGQALRTCLVVGMHVDSQSDTLTRYHLEHHRRLWWTVYMYERMLSSKAGMPLSFMDYSISAELPSDFPMAPPDQRPPGCEHYVFPRSEYLTNCVKIVQINGYILSQLYQRQPKDNILPLLQNVIKQLFQWKANLSPMCQVDFSQKHPLQITRQLTNLFTEYFQGINLAVRPLLFHFVSVQLKTFKNNYTYLDLEDFSDSTTMLLNCSLQASVCSIRALWALMEPDLVALFGYMDREYLFTSAFTLLLFTTTFGIHERAYEHLDHALIMFDRMIALGNNAAELRRAQLLTLMINLDFHNILQDLIQKHTGDNDLPGTETATPAYTHSPMPVSVGASVDPQYIAATAGLPSATTEDESLSTLDDLINATIAQSYSAPMTKQGTKIIETNAEQLDPTNVINMDTVENLLEEMIKTNQTDNKLWKDITDQAMWLGSNMEPVGPGNLETDLGTFPLEES